MVKLMISYVYAASVTFSSMGIYKCKSYLVVNVCIIIVSTPISQDLGIVVNVCTIISSMLLSQCLGFVVNESIIIACNLVFRLDDCCHV